MARRHRFLGASALGLWLFFSALALLMAIQPINILPARLVLIASLAGWLACFLILFWKKPFLRWGAIFGAALVAIVYSLPARPLDKNSLRERYVEALQSYTGTPYVWGGEGKLGIDCSGLPRKAFRDALFQEGLRTWDGGLLREAAREWWCDVSARALAAGDDGYAFSIERQGVLKALGPEGLQEGDMAITQSGVHCLVYLSGSRWIQANPEAGKVGIYDAATTTDAWFKAPVAIYRWTLLR